MLTSEELQQELLPLKDSACQNWNHPATRNRYLTKMIRKIQQSKKIFKKSPSKAAFRDCYEEVESKIFSDLFNIETKKICSQYNHEKATIITWLNNYGKYRYLDCDRQHYKAPLSLDATVSREEGGMTWKDLLAAPPENECIKYYFELVQWIASDPIVIHKNREKKISEIIARDNETKIEINAQQLLLALFEGTQKSQSKKEFNHSEIGRRFNIKSQTVRTFYERTCRPLIKAEAKKRGLEV